MLNTMYGMYGGEMQIFLKKIKCGRNNYRLTTTLLFLFKGVVWHGMVSQIRV
jgi:hypothetical protein